MEHLVDPEATAVAEAWHFSHVVRSRGLIFLSGVMGTRSDGSVPADPEEQLGLLFGHLRRQLGLAGAGPADLVEITTFHVGLREHLATFARVRDAHLAAPYPAWTAIGVAELVTPGALVELRAVAEDPAG